MRLLDGFKFGMLLQLAVGPMCLLVFNTASQQGLLSGIILMSSIALVDALFILLAILGVTKILSKTKVTAIVKTIGAIVLILFGINTLLGTFETSASEPTIFNDYIFLQGLILTLSNPLTIVFWGGVFTTKLSEGNWTKKELIPFSIGCFFATVFFLSLVAFIGNQVGVFLPTTLIKLLNVFVGIVIIGFGVKMILTINKS